MMKILQITDCHLVRPGERLFTIDPAERLSLAIADINRHHGDAELCVFTGDLAHDGDPAAYRLLKTLLAELSVPVQLMAGNHDDRRSLIETFPKIPVDDGGFLQSVRTASEGVLMFLDTLQPGVHTGAYCDRRCRWLETSLSEAGDRPVFLFLHHPPMSIGMPRLDQYRIADNWRFAEIVRRFPAVRHIFFGHVHRPVSGSWRRIPFSSLRGTNHQNWLDFSDARENISSLEPPAYSVILADADSTVVHHHDFADDNPRFIYDPAAPPSEQVRVLG